MSIYFHWFSLSFIELQWFSLISIDFHWCSLIFIALHWFSLDFHLFFSLLLSPKDEPDMWQHFLTVSCKSELSCSSYDFRKINHIPTILIFIAVHIFSLAFIDFHWFSLIYTDCHWMSFFSSPSSLLPPKDESDMWQHFLTVSCKSELSYSSYDFRKINHIPIILIFITLHFFHWSSLIFIEFHLFALMFIDLHWCSLIFIDFHWISFFSSPSSLLQPKDESDIWQHFLTVSCKS